MVDQVRVGVVNTSWYADALHLPSLTSHPRATVVALCGRRREQAQELAHKFGIPSVYTDYRAMFEQAGLDAVLIAPPDDLHYPMTMDALDAGLHVLCEKPLGMNGTQARAMAEKAAAAKVKHMVFFTFRWLPHTRALFELIQDGFVGRFYHCHISYVHGGGRDGMYRWRLDAARSNGILGDLGSHLIDLARWYNGEIGRVSGQLATYVSRPGADGREPMPANDAATLQVEFGDGAQGTIHVSAVAHVGERGLQQRIVLYGEAGTLEADFAFGNFGSGREAMAIRGLRAGETTFQELPIPAHIWGDVDPAQPMDVFNKQSVGDRYFIDCILEDRPCSPDFEDGLRVQEVIDAAIESHQTGRWVTVNR
jgi:predicted dehydrogenase